MSWPRARSHSAQVSGSTSSAVGSRPAICPPSQVVNEISGPNAPSEIREQVQTRPRRRDLLDVVAERLEQRRGVARGLRRTPDRSWRRRAAGRAPARSAGGRDRRRPARRSRPPAAAAPRSRRRARRPRARRARVAVSATVRVSTPSQTRKLCPSSGPTDTRPRAGLRPTSPQQEAGIRIEPPPSLPCATGTIPAATAAAAPPLEPPGVRSVSHGLRVGPNRRGSVVGRIPISGIEVLPTITNPASRSRRTRNASWPGDEVAEQVAAHRQRHPRDRPVVLDRDRHAGERPGIAGPDRVGVGQRRLVGDVRERVDRRLELVDPAQRGLHELASGQLARPDQRGQLEWRSGAAAQTRASCDTDLKAIRLRFRAPAPRRRSRRHRQ